MEKISATFLIGFTILLCACSTSPHQKVTKICPDCQKSIIDSPATPPLIAYSRNSKNSGKVLYIYIEGDGVPWVKQRFPAKNPNSQKLTALRLMAQDPHNSVYINRPCYGYALPPAECTPDLWTFGRYSLQVVDALSSALDAIIKHSEYEKLVLAGHSGGGTLAMLLAHKRNDISAVVTIGANLNHSEWTEFFNYLPLNNSENLHDYPVLSPQIVRIHYAGGKDKLVPAHLTQKASSSDPHAQFMLIEEFDHICCWAEIWPDIINKISNLVSKN